MSQPAARVPCYLVEWYRSELTEEPLEDTAATLYDSAEALTAEGAPVHLLTILAVPTDEVVFGVFTASSEALVAQTCQRAGMPAQRLTAAIDAHITHPEE